MSNGRLLTSHGLGVLASRENIIRWILNLCEHWKDESNRPRLRRELDEFVRTLRIGAIQMSLQSAALGVSEEREGSGMPRADLPALLNEAAQDIALLAELEDGNKSDEERTKVNGVAIVFSDPFRVFSMISDETGGSSTTPCKHVLFRVK